MITLHIHEWGQIDDEYIYQCGQSIQSRQCLTCGFRQYRDVSEDATDDAWYEYPRDCSGYKGPRKTPLTCKEVLINFSKRLIEYSVDCSWMEHESEDFHKGVEFMERNIELLCEELTGEWVDSREVKRLRRNG